MGLKIFAPARLKCTHWGCGAEVDTRVELKEHECESRADLDGFLSVEHVELPAGWTRQPYGAYLCPEHKR